MRKELVELREEYKRLTSEQLSKMYLNQPKKLGMMLYLNLKEKFLNTHKIDLYNIKEWDNECDIFSVEGYDNNRWAYMFYGNIMVTISTENGVPSGMDLYNIRDSESKQIHNGGLEGEYEDEN